MIKSWTQTDSLQHPSDDGWVCNAISHLKISGFRNYNQCELHLDGRPVVLVGDNGMGKTNVLEAISLLAAGRGIRRARVEDMMQNFTSIEGQKIAQSTPLVQIMHHDSVSSSWHQTLGWGVSALVNSVCGEVDIATGAKPNDSRRHVRINGSDGDVQSRLNDYVHVVWLTPQMDRLFLEGASSRRRFLDRLVCGFDPAHGGRIAGYEKAMRDRNRLLQEGCTDDHWLSALEKQIADRAIAIGASRNDFVHKLNQVCQEPLGPFPGATLVLRGVVENGLDASPAIEIESRLLESLRVARPLDGESGTTSVGVHKTDMTVIHPVKNCTAEYCSTGEQKALLVAIILGHCRLQSAETGMIPLLLLDEVAAHLDQKKRHALFDTVLEYGAQAWLTGTDESTFAYFGNRVQYFRVHQATVTPFRPW